MVAMETIFAVDASFMYATEGIHSGHLWAQWWGFPGTIFVEMADYVWQAVKRRFWKTTREHLLKIDPPAENCPKP
jgi:hypothetical protein